MSITSVCAYVALCGTKNDHVVPSSRCLYGRSLSLSAFRFAYWIRPCSNAEHHQPLIVWPKSHCRHAYICPSFWRGMRQNFSRDPVHETGWSLPTVRQYWCGHFTSFSSNTATFTIGHAKPQTWLPWCRHGTRLRWPQEQTSKHVVRGTRNACHTALTIKWAPTPMPVGESLRPGLGSHSFFFGCSETVNEFGWAVLCLPSRLVSILRGRPKTVWMMSGTPDMGEAWHAGVHSACDNSAIDVLLLSAQPAPAECVGVAESDVRACGILVVVCGRIGEETSDRMGQAAGVPFFIFFKLQFL